VQLSDVNRLQYDGSTFPLQLGSVGEVEGETVGALDGDEETGDIVGDDTEGERDG